MDELNSIVNRLQVDNFRARIVARRNQRRNESWFFRMLFRRKGMNWMVANILPAIILFLWSTVGAFALIIFLSH